MKENTLVRVDWEDANSQCGWNSRKRMQEVDLGYACTSVGFVIRETKKNLAIAGTIGENGSCTDPISIPKGCIKKIRRIKE